MGRNKVPICVVLCIAATVSVGLTGCSAFKPSSPTTAKKPLVPGVVDLAGLTARNPDYLLVRQTDNALKVYSSALASGTMSGSLPVIDADEVFTAQTLQVSDTPGYSEADLKGRLESSGAKRLDALKGRLDRSNQLAHDEAQKAADVSESAQFETSRDELLQSRYNALLAMLSENSEHRLNLNVQIGALTKDRDPVNPPTAPDDYWAKLLTDKKKELVALDSSRQEKLNAADLALDAEIAVLRQSIHDEKAAAVALNDKKLKQRSAARISDYQRLLSERQASIISAARDFDREMAGELVIDAATPLATGAVHGAPVVNLATEAAWRGRVQATMATLIAQRSRQVVLVTEETRRAVLDVAKRQNLSIVSWKTSTGRQDLTLRVLADLRRHGWTE